MGATLSLKLGTARVCSTRLPRGLVVGLLPLKFENTLYKLFLIGLCGARPGNGVLGLWECGSLLHGLTNGLCM